MAIPGLAQMRSAVPEHLQGAGHSGHALGAHSFPHLPSPHVVKVSKSSSHRDSMAADSSTR